ncbi:MAG: tetratricopeptide repeat protein [Bacteroidales bacterium]|nr:tetratricopeptide repeat protein [Bacteroidales bacterium]
MYQLLIILSLLSSSTSRKAEDIRIGQNFELDSLIHVFQNSRRAKRNETALRLIPMLYQENFKNVYVIPENYASDENFLVGGTYSLMSRYACRHDRYDLAFDWGESGIDYLMDSDARDFLASALNNMYTAYVRRDDYVSAYPYLIQASRLADETGSDIDKSHALAYLADIDILLGDTEEASALLTRARTLAGTDPDGAHAHIASSFSRLNMQLEHYQDAIAYAEEAHAVISAYPLNGTFYNPVDIPQSLNLMAEAYFQAGYVSMAEDLYSRSLEIYEELDFPYGTSVSLNGLAAVARRQGHTSEALRYYRRANMYATASGYVLQQAVARKGMSEILSDASPAEALSSYDIYVDISDSLRRVNENLLMQKYSDDYDFNQWAREYDAHKNSLRNRRAQIVILVFIGTVLLLVVLVMAFLLRIRFRNVRILKQTNDIKAEYLSLYEKSGRPSEIKENDDIAEPEFTPKEKEIARYCCEGLTNKDICERMGISPRTVDTHKTNIFRKLGVSSTVDMVRFFRRHSHLLAAVILAFLSAASMSAQERLGRNPKIDSLYYEYVSSAGMKQIRVAREIITLAEDTVFHSADDPVLEGDIQGSDAIRGYMFFCMAYYASTAGRLDLTVEYGSRSLEYLRLSGPDWAISLAANIVGVAYHKMGDDISALPFLETSYEIEKQSNNIVDIAINLKNLADIYYAFEDYDIAERLLFESINMKPELSDDYPGFDARRYTALAKIYIAKENWRDAYTYAKKSFDITSADYHSGTFPDYTVEYYAENMYLLGVIAIADNRVREGLSLIDQSIVVYARVGENGGLSRCYTTLGDFERNRRDMRAAADKYMMAIEYSRRCGDIMQEQKAVLGLAIALRDNDPSTSLKSLHRYDEIADSLYRKKKLQRYNEYKVRYEVVEFDHQIEMQKQEIATRRSTVALLHVLIVGLLLLIALLFVAFKANRRHGALLMKSNDINDRLVALTAATNADLEKKQAFEQRMAGLGAASQVHLTDREIEIVRLSCEGLVTKEIASRLNISVRTVDTHKTNIFKKLGIKSTRELIDYAEKAGITF